MPSRSALRAISVSLALSATTLAALPEEPPEEPPAVETVEAGAWRISGPNVHENLAIFAIHGSDQPGARPVTTLEEAIESRRLVVHETGDVNELMVENVGDEEIYIQAGDIVKGGKQDRTLAVDMVVPPKSGRISIQAFCVEQSRWSARGAESVSSFSSAKSRLSSKSLRMAAMVDANQSEVWREVARAQQKLASAVGGEVTDSTSATSLQLTLEHRNVNSAIDGYVAALNRGMPIEGDVIGYAYAINGSLSGAEVYGSTALFRKLWPKMLRSIAVEAVSERSDSARHTVTIDSVASMFAAAEKGTQQSERPGGAARTLVFGSKDATLFETRLGDQGEWIHRSYMTR